ncbi:MAG: hypothetical protein WC061_08530 [Melioribacteraceae bacterium]
MIIDQKQIRISKTARYFISGKHSEKIDSVWIVLHGYGQLAQDFIKYFKPVADESTIIIAPEALNRFYLKGFDGKVGAAWMTKENRVEEIADYIGYLDSIYEEVICNGNFRNARVTALGFSQGSAAAFRWIINSSRKIDRLILWGGGIPPETDLNLSRDLLNSIELKIVAGDKDQFITEEQIGKEIERLKKSKLIYQLYRFNGGHEINPGALRQLK